MRGDAKVVDDFAGGCAFVDDGHQSQATAAARTGQGIDRIGPL
jgi:hypothetical protein